jgi:hypothetical protein
MKRCLLLRCSLRRATSPFVLARLHDLDMVTAAYGACRKTYPEKKILLCQSGRIVRRSGRDPQQIVFD